MLVDGNWPTLAVEHRVLEVFKMKTTTLHLVSRILPHDRAEF